MIIAATSDVHSPRYYEDFIRAIDSMQVKPDLFLLAGDMIERGHPPEEYERVYNALFGKITCPIVACFGNNEFIPDTRTQIKAKIKDIKFLDGEAIEIKIGYTTIGIVGTIGSLDTPTNWQKANIPNIEKIYQERMATVDRFLHRMMTHLKIVLMHYAPTYKTLVGENPRFYGGLGSQMYENVFLQRKPTLVIHGHSHKGSKFAWIDTIPIFNVSFPVNKEIVVINTEKIRPGLAKFV
ncbi:MAG: metallophosphoesterase [Candidatus Aenigmatarchaeota archaeon]|nr:metallophosphoesterase [Candidatus Aenigmarchaeota archaeon]